MSGICTQSRTTAHDLMTAPQQSSPIVKFSGACRDRTGDLRLAKGADCARRCTWVHEGRVSSEASAERKRLGARTVTKAVTSW